MSIRGSASGNLTAENPLPVLENIENQWWWFLLLGVGMLLLGLIAIAAPYYFALKSVLLFGILLLMGGAAQLISAFWAGRWSGFFVHLVTGILYLVIGALTISKPTTALAGLTLLLAAFFITNGLFRIVSALNYRFAHWGWALLSGFVTLFLGILIWSEFREMAYWVIGLFIGIELVINGWMWIMLALTLRHVAAMT